MTGSLIRRIFIYDILTPTTHRPLAKRDPKAERLKQFGALNAHPERVRAARFHDSTFFDPRDVVQVKYEMLREVRLEGTSKAEAAALFGVSRPTFYQTEAAFARAGLSGLLPQQRGPKGAHKLTVPVMAFIEERIAQEGRLAARALAREVKAKFGLLVHPRSIERAIARKKKR